MTDKCEVRINQDRTLWTLGVVERKDKSYSGNYRRCGKKATKTANEGFEACEEHFEFANHFAADAMRRLVVSEAARWQGKAA